MNFVDRAMGSQSQNLNAAVGDFVLRRADGLFSYQLAVVVDDHLQGITHVVRGDDLLKNTPRQIYLQHVLGCQNPHYLHLPIVINETGEKLSKQTNAPPLKTDTKENVLRELNTAAQHLGIWVSELHYKKSLDDWLTQAMHLWKKEKC
jgi:glutamyl-Q tRNA(Asp) synthetase